MEHSLADIRASGNSSNFAFPTVVLAQQYVTVGRNHDCVRLIDDLLVECESANNLWYIAEAHRVRGDGWRALSDENAEAAYQRALAIGREQHAKSFELRAATSLARLWQSRGKIVEAHDLLLPVYGWFTEGFDTHDLKEAKALLDQLAL
jgi:hypothetical protein